MSRPTSLLRPVLASVTVSLLGLAVAASAVLVSASAQSQQNPSSRFVDTHAHDMSKAAPITGLTAEQVAAKKASETSQNTSAGGLQVFRERGTTVTRNSVRSAVDQSLASGVSAQRSATLRQTNSAVQLTIAQAEQAERVKQMDADVAKVKAEAARIAEEKRKAEELLRQQLLAQLLAKKQAAGSADHNDDSDPKNQGKKSQSKKSQGKKNSQKNTSQQSSSSSADDELDLSLEELQSLSSQSGVNLPLRPGTYRVGAHFGQYGPWARYHTGQDFPAAYGTPIYAVTSGVVGSSVGAWWPGINVVLHHSGGGSTLYAHMSAKTVRPGQMVRAGQVIGYVGSTGNSFGNHLHFEYYPPGTTPGDVYSATNPMAFLRRLGLPI